MKPHEYFASELARFKRAFDGKRMPPLLAAVDFCHLHNLPLEEWIALAVRNVILERHHLAGWRGRGNSPKSLVIKDYIDHRRWAAFTHALRCHGLPPPPKRKAGKPRKDEAHKLEAYRVALADAEQLLKTKIEGMPAAAGSTRQIEASFHRIATLKAHGKWMPEIFSD